MNKLVALSLLLLVVTLGVEGKPTGNGHGKQQPKKHGESNVMEPKRACSK